MAQPDSAPETFYITTPIYYVTAAPHIGSAYTTVAADLLARWHRQRGETAWFLTGTDEHGQKVLRSAEKAGQNPQAFVDGLVANEWKPVLDTIDAANDQFVRTTDPDHVLGVQEFWRRLNDAGHVYAGEYSGMYCVDCEEFKAPDDLFDGPDGTSLCKIHERPVELVKEKNYFFRLSAFAPRLLELYESQPDFIGPDAARNEILNHVRGGLDDLSISRSTFDWGIKVPWDDSQVLYVWIDALLNYATAAGLYADLETFQKRWPAVHLVGRDILRFHSVIWPAMLMAAGLEPPRRVFAHGWLLVGGKKMSKSNATGIMPSQIIDTFGSDAYRYYFMRTIAFGSDGSFSWEHMHAVYTSELANNLGNLASRVAAMVGKYFGGSLPEPGETTAAEQKLVDLLADTVTKADAAITRLAINEALTAVHDFVGEVNIYVTEQEPWKVAKDESEEGRARLGTILYAAAESLRAIAVLHHPTMPKATEALWDSLGAQADLGPLAGQNLTNAGRWGQLPAGSVITKGAVLFPRIIEEPTDEPA